MQTKVISHYFFTHSVHATTVTICLAVQIRIQFKAELPVSKSAIYKIVSIFQIVKIKSWYAGMPHLFPTIHSKKKENDKNGKGASKSGFTDGMKYVHENLVGSHAMVQSPFGNKRMTYADYTASGRSLYMIENYISKYVLGYYGNTHTSTSFASMQTSQFREDAKNIIRKCCNANADDAVIFCGSGATSAIHKLIGVLGLGDASIGKSAVVFLGPYEHHSNILPWKETGAKLVRIEEDRKGQVNLQHLETVLEEHSSGSWKMKVNIFE